MNAHRIARWMATAMTVTLLAACGSDGENADVSGAGGGSAGSSSDGGVVDGGGADSANPDHTPPTISNVQVQVVNSIMVKVTWDTDEPCTDQVEYGDDTTYGSTTDKSTSLAKTHAVTVQVPKTGQEVHLRAVSWDNAGNEAKSGDETATTTIRDIKIRSGHPVLFIDPALEAKAKAKTSDLSSFTAYAKSRQMKNTNDPNDTAAIKAEVKPLVSFTSPHDYEWVSQRYAMSAYLSDDPLAKAYGTQYLQALLDKPFSFASGDGPMRGRLFALGILYDWLFDDLSPELRKKVRANILDALDYIDKEHYTLSSPAPDTHSRLAYTYALVAILPLRYEIASDGAAQEKRYYEWLERIVGVWRNIMNPVQNWFGKGGGHQMGWAYAAGYNSPTPYLAWEYATDEESWLGAMNANQPLWFLYGARNWNRFSEVRKGAYTPFPFSGDAFDSSYNPDQGTAMLVGNMVNDNPQAQWLYNHMQTGKTQRFFDILLRDFDSGAGASPSALPLSRLFENAGFAIMRDSWDPAKNTLTVFKSSSCYSFNHVHRDQNAFTIFYKGPLAMDSGGYNVMGAWGSEHWYNYYIRTIAHNSMLVYEPGEDIGMHNVSNDGGQKFFKKQSPSLQQCLPGGSNHLDGVERFENTTDYTFTRGNATLAYSSSKMKYFGRSMVYLRQHSYDHPAIVVFDDVVSTKASFKKTYLLHASHEPNIKGTTIVVETSDGQNSGDRSALYQQTLLPEAATITKLGGKNHQEFFVADDGKGHPKNYDIVKKAGASTGKPLNYASYDGLTYENMGKRALREAGLWRVEVSPSKPNLEDLFLHVLSVTDDKQSHSAVKATLVKSTNCVGAVLIDNDGGHKTLVLFRKHGTSLDDTIDLSGAPSFDTTLIVDLVPDGAYTVSRSSGELKIKRESGGKTLASAQGTIYLK